MKTITEKVGDGNPPWSGPRTFSAFLTTDACRKVGIDLKFIDKLIQHGRSIKTRTALKIFARERHPDNWTDWRTPTPEMPFGKESMDRLWAAFLEWQEG
jgi:hypothetical protein